MKHRLYPAKLIRVIDGDTVKLDLDLGLDVHRSAKARLARITSPEIRGDAKGLGLAARHCAMKWFRREEEGFALVCKTVRRGQFFGQWIAEVMLISEKENLNLADYMVEQGHARYTEGDL